MSIIQYSFNSVQAGQDAFQLLLDRRLLLVVEPARERPERVAGDVAVCGLLPDLVEGRREGVLVGCPPDALQVAVDLVAQVVGDLEPFQPSGEGLPTAVRVEGGLVGLALEPPVGQS